MSAVVIPVVVIPVGKGGDDDVGVGPSVGGATGTSLVRGTAEATFTLRMAWRRPIAAPGEGKGTP